MSEHFLSQAEGNAIVYCEGAFQTTYGKTAHGLIRFTRRYNIVGLVDSTCAGLDAGKVLDNKPNGVRISSTVAAAVEYAAQMETPATHVVVGLATDGGRLTPEARLHLLGAADMGLHIHCGLHQFLSDDPDFIELARKRNIHIRDIRKPPSREKLHFFSGKIEEVTSLKIAVLGTDSAVGKRTTAWLLVQGLERAGHSAQMIGTGQTAWMQGAKYSIIFDSLVNDFVSGEIEHAVWSAWNETRPEAIVIEGQGSLMNPAYPGGYEILAAGRPDIVILQHAPARKEYDGFPGYPIQPLAQQIHLIRLLSGKEVAAVAVNHENIPPEKVPYICEAISHVTGLPTYDLLLQGTDELVKLLAHHYI